MLTPRLIPMLTPEFKITNSACDLYAGGNMLTGETLYLRTLAWQILDTHLLTANQSRFVSNLENANLRSGSKTIGLFQRYR